MNTLQPSQDAELTIVYIGENPRDYVTGKSMKSNR